MGQNKRSPYRVWLVIFAIVFLLGLLGIFGLRALIAIIIRHPEMLKTELPTVIQSGIIILVDAVLAVVAVVLSIRTTLKRSTYQLWLLIIATGFMLKFGIGLVTNIRDFNILSPHSFAAPSYRADYYALIISSVITLIYGGLAVAAFILSRRISIKT